MIEDLIFVKLVELWVSWMNGYIMFWTWNNSPQGGCRDCSKLSKNEIVWYVPRTICNCFSGIPRTFIVVSSLWTEHGYTWDHRTVQTMCAQQESAKKNEYPSFSLKNKDDCFWNPREMIFFDYLEKDITISCAYYPSLPDLLNQTARKTFWTIHKWD